MLASDLMPDIDLRYRNTFTDAQKYVWMNDEQNDIFQTFKIERDPVQIPLVTGSKFYLIPSEIKYIEQIRAATIQLSPFGTDTEFTDLRYYRNFNDVPVNYGPWYTIVADKIYINVPNQDVTGYFAVFFIDGYATPIENGDTELSITDKYMEIMKYGVLRRIAEARKDVVMSNNYTASRDELIANMLWTEVTGEPQWVQPTSSTFFRNHSRGYVTNGW